MRLTPRLSVRALIRDESGSAIVLIAPMLAVCVGMAAFGVDTMRAYTVHEKLRTVAEAAATAGVRALPDQTEVRRIALLFAEKNRPEGTTGTLISNAEIVFGHWHKNTKTFEPNPDVEPLNAVQVGASLTASKGNSLPSVFGSFLGVDTYDLSTAAIASFETSVPCVVALEPSATAITLNSNARINTPNCEVHSRSTSMNALTADSNSQLKTKRTCLNGGFAQNSNSVLTPAPETMCEAVSDPFADVPAPTVATTCTAANTNKKLNSQTVTLGPGTYCGGLEIDGNSVVTFNAGVYVIKDGKFLVNSNSRISGSGVTFYLTGAAALLEFNSNTQASLSAPTSGTYAGMLIFRDRAFGGVHKFDSNTAGLLDGAFYFPNGTFLSNSNSQIASQSTCFMLVANKIQFDSNAGISGVNMAADPSTCPWTQIAIGGKRSKLVG